MSLAKTQRSPRETGGSGPDFLACLAAWREEILVPAPGRAGKSVALSLLPILLVHR